MNEYDVVMGSYRLWHLRAARGATQGNFMNRQLEIAGIAGTSTPSPAISNCRLGVGFQAFSTTAEGRGLTPPASVVADDTGDATTLT
ncbi:hypothetical protein [Luteimonas arsenica]|uniref:hypothetical protein n=1 Tax=Luteimonas arsenica TaxID=1586242 RepID=UPI00105483F8|nr:hypothetical protein [Luteimonas arsenica]